MRRLLAPLFALVLLTGCGAAKVAAPVTVTQTAVAVTVLSTVPTTVQVTSTATVTATPTTSEEESTLTTEEDSSTSVETSAVRTVLPTKTYKGSGDDVVSVGSLSDPAILQFDCPSCESNVTLKTDGGEGLLVNTIGSYSGSHFVNLQDDSVTTTLQVGATGAWTVTVRDLSTASRATSGKGDTALFIGATTTKAKITNRGESNFAVHVYGGSDGEDLAVNEIGSYSGTVPLAGPAFVQVESSGSWSIAAS